MKLVSLYGCEKVSALIVCPDRETERGCCLLPARGLISDLLKTVGGRLRVLRIPLGAASTLKEEVVLIEFTRPKRTHIDEKKLSKKGFPRVHRVTFCCEELADNVMQVPCFLSTDEAELWFNPSNDDHGQFYMRFCPFCGEKIRAIELSQGKD